MKITLDIPDGIICAFLNGVRTDGASMALVSYSLASDDLKDGNTVKLPGTGSDNADDDLSRCTLAALIDGLAAQLIRSNVDWDAFGDTAARNLQYVAGVIDCADKIKSAILSSAKV